MNGKSQLQLWNNDDVDFSYSGTLASMFPSTLCPKEGNQEETGTREVSRGSEGRAKPAGVQRGRESGNWTLGHSNIFTGSPKMSQSSDLVSPQGSQAHVPSQGLRAL